MSRLLIAQQKIEELKKQAQLLEIVRIKEEEACLARKKAEQVEKALVFQKEQTKQTEKILEFLKAEIKGIRESQESIKRQIGISSSQ